MLFSQLGSETWPHTLASQVRPCPSPMFCAQRMRAIRGVIVPTVHKVCSQNRESCFLISRIALCPTDINYVKIHPRSHNVSALKTRMVWLVGAGPAGAEACKHSHARKHTDTCSPSVLSGPAGFSSTGLSPGSSPGPQSLPGPGPEHGRPPLQQRPAGPLRRRLAGWQSAGTHRAWGLCPH